MHPQGRKPTVAQLILLTSFLAFCVIGFVSSAAPATQDNGAASTDERQLEDKIPKHLPIKIKIKKEKEKAFKDLKNEKWFRDLEIEVTNTGNKPIYFLALLLEMPDMISESGRQLGYPLIYGRKELTDFTAKVLAEDMPIKPGESHTFKILDKWAGGLELMKARLNKPHPKRVQIRFQVINFGDATGFMGIDGLSVPRPKKTSCVDQKNQTDKGQQAFAPPGQSLWLWRNLHHLKPELPAINLREIFFPTTIKGFQTQMSLDQIFAVRAHLVIAGTRNRRP